MVKESKKETVDEFAELIDKYPVIGVVNMVNLPTKTVQDMRAKLRDNNNILKMTKKRLLKLAFAKAKKPNIPNLENHFKGLPALIFTKDNPFTLNAFLEKNKTNAPAKGGQEAPKDIIVKAGPTSFSPGPIISQLGKYQIKAGVEGGKIVIKEDAIAIKQGEIIDSELASILTRLGIEPIEIGLNMTAAYEDGTIFTSDVLYIDEKDYANKFATSYNDSLNLAVYAAYPTEDSIKILLNKINNESRSLSIFANILTDETSMDILRKAHAQVMSLANNLPKEALSDELKSSKAPVVKETPKKEPQQKSEEPKEESAAAGLGSLFG